eukprot:TRINITY_DN13741_c0_g1_i1.p1 TRINITY_DN13741_c0_g1~~TRINITY_DN13741_c0_g1_i1.p1  ORF type:complete len:347 (-),score=103.25 TRINITY_DN13741_c0_g1_i1:487-1527(-)
MRAIGIKVVPTAKTVDSLLELIVPKPVAVGKNLLVKVRGAATNPVDYKVLSRQGEPGTVLESPKIVGFDGAGVVESVGDECSLFKPGDEVFFAGAINKQGCFAEYIAIDERIVGRKPKGLSWHQAASVPLCWLTAYESLVYQLGIPKDNTKKETVLVVGGAGGVGSYAIQIAKKLLNLEVIATASRSETADYCTRLGADFILNHRNDLKQELEKLGRSESVQYIFDCYGLSEETWAAYVENIRPFGKICSINPRAKLDLGLTQWKSLTFTATLMFTRPVSGVDIQAQHEMLNLAAECLENGSVRHTMEREYPFTVKGVEEALMSHIRQDAIGKNGLVFTAIEDSKN